MTGRVGFIMLCHTALDRAAQVARHWAERHCPVIVHVDRRVDTWAYDRMRAELADCPNIRFSTRHVCEWGTWGLVAATLDAAERMLSEFAQVRHVYLASGSCLPLRPVADLQAYLDQRPGTDFIESVTTEHVGWTIGGLDYERFTLRFPFSWRRQRALFDGYVRLQRRVGFRRRIPAGLVPHLGSQWWCLTRKTLSAILNHPARALHDRYFRRVWIPDESYFQTLVRQISADVDSRSLTLSKFDLQGKPHMFFDDHLQLLQRSDCFVARKIWPGAEGLYQTFLTDARAPQPAGEPNPGRIDRLFGKAVERRIKGRPGLVMQSRFPAGSRDQAQTAAPYSVFQGFSELFEDFEGWLGKTTGTRVHGHLFHPDRVDFALGETIYNGALPAHPRWRDYDPQAFLTNLVWSTRGERQCFQFGPADNQALCPLFAQDRNAQVSVISGAWALALFRDRQDLANLRQEAARLQKIEGAFVARLKLASTKARIHLWTLAEFVQDPVACLQTIVQEMNPRSSRRLTEAPQLIDMTGFGQFLQTLRNQGMPPTLMGDFMIEDAARPDWTVRAPMVK